MKVLHNIGNYNHSNYNTREQVAACREQLSFDGVYLNVWENRDLLKNRQHKTILFVMWVFVGRTNEFDAIPNNLPLERYCDWPQIFDLVSNYNCELGSHSWTHRDMRELSDSEIKKELISDPWPVTKFAYPYGHVDERVARLVKEAGYQDAFSVTQGNGEIFQRRRQYL
jgi:peptidoglycan/xylan/chitin deacetylase (PgdA/CDA1 family)